MRPLPRRVPQRPGRRSEQPRGRRWRRRTGGLPRPSAPGVATASGAGGTGAGRIGGGGKGDDPTTVDPTNPRSDNPTSADENRALIEATRNGGGPVKVGRDTIEPGAQNSSFVQNLPAPLVAVLALFGVAALTGGAPALRRRLPRTGGD